MSDLIVRGGTVIDGTGRPPFTADVAISDGRIVDVGSLSCASAREIDADGALVTPGWIDAHTHYDAQVTWDEDVEGSAANGVTTVIMGNCGVGFAPVRPGGTAELIDLMEGVEDIPGSALSEGMPWGAWESFPEYLDFLRGRRWSLDVGAQVPHGALRYHVMGDRAIHNAPARPEELDAMAEATAAAVGAGAIGFSTSRTLVHRSMRRGGFVPGTFAPFEELRAIGDAVARAGGAVLQAIPASGAGLGELTPAGPEQSTVAEEVELFGRLSKATGLPVVFTLLQCLGDIHAWRGALGVAERHNSDGAHLHPMVATRAVTMLSTLGAYHAFMRRPTYLRLSNSLSFDDLVTELRRPEVKAAILAEHDLPHRDPGSMDTALAVAFRNAVARTYPLREPLDYEPLPETSFAGIAAATGRDALDVLYDFMLEDGGRAVALLLGSNYHEHSLDVSREMMSHPDTVMGLSDAGAHVRFVCDMGAPTFNLTHWGRDRVRGLGLSLEHVIAKTTSVPARIWGLDDRGVIEPGRRADINVIDYDRLASRRPELRYDLPAGGARYLQAAEGYVATLVAGEITRLDDADTGARPGRLVDRHISRR